MSVLILEQAVLSGRWRLSVVRPTVRRAAMIVAAALTAALVIKLLGRPWNAASGNAVTLVIGAWAAALLVPAWNAQVVKPMMDRVNGGAANARVFYAFFEVFALVALPCLLLRELFRSWSSVA